MTSVGAFWKWAFIGGLTASILVVAQASAVGGVEGMLQVGEESLLRPLIEKELGQVPVAEGPGHDGQIYYAIGMDLDGDLVTEAIGDSAYRFRRILYPVVASLGGLLQGRALLFGMIGVAIASTSVAAGSVAAIALRIRQSDWLAVAVLLNPGIWLSVRLLTADVLALAMMTCGLYFVLTLRRSSAIGSFALSALAKDVHLLTPAGLAFDRKRGRWALLLVPGLILAIWSIWLQITQGNAFTSRGNLTLPFAGLAEASSNWVGFSTGEWVYLVFALSSVVVGLIVGVFRASWLRWPILLWSSIGIISSNWVWDFGNNAARAFAPIAVLIALSYGTPEFDSRERGRLERIEEAPR